MAAKKKEVVESEADSKNIVGNILKQFKSDHFNFEETVHWNVSTGSLLLDAATGGVSPGLWRICGNNNSGKTPTCLEIIRNVFEGVENTKALWILAEGRDISKENRERCGLTFVYDFNEWNDKTVLIIKSNIYELFIKIVRDLLANNPTQIRYVFCVDSLNGLITRADSEKDIEENSLVAGQAVLSKKMFQNLSLGMFTKGHLLLLISQVTAEIKLNQYEKTPNRGGSFSGGNSALHAATYILNYESSYAGDFILENSSGKFNDGKTKVIGQNVKVTLNKSEKEASKKLTVVYPIKYGRAISGIWREREVGDSLMMWGMLIKSGAWLTFTPEAMKVFEENELEVPAKIHGMDNLYKMLEENPKVCEFLYNWFLKMMIS